MLASIVKAVKAMESGVQASAGTGSLSGVDHMHPLVRRTSCRCLCCELGFTSLGGRVWAQINALLNTVGMFAIPGPARYLERPDACDSILDQISRSHHVQEFRASYTPQCAR